MTFRSPRKSYFSLSFFYFFDFASLGFFLPYFPLYLQSLKMSKWEIGLLLSILMIARVGIPIFWGRVSDKSGKGYEILLSNAFLSSFILICLYFTKSFWGILMVLALSMFFRTSLVPLAEAISLKFISTTQTSYGFIRVWGSLGFLSAALVGGSLVSAWGIQIVPSLLIFTFFASAIAISFLEKEEPEQTIPSISAWKHLISRNFIVILISGMLMQTSHGAYYEYFSIFMKQQGMQAWAIGLLWSVAIFSEILMMLYWKKIERLFNTYQILWVSFLAACVRWLGLSFAHSLFLIIILQTLHALSFAAFHLANIYWFKRNVLSADQSTAQALYSSAVFGLGGVIGFLGAGRLTEYWSLSSIYLCSSVIAFMALAVFGWGFKIKTFKLRHS